MFVICVRIHVFPEHVAGFIEATTANARASRQEPANLRFDLLQWLDDPCRFTLYEVYHNEEGFKAHQQTPHYFTWRAAVAPMMASPRIGEKHRSVFPEPWE